jgi:hypothetical protein
VCSEGLDVGVCRLANNAVESWRSLVLFSTFCVHSIRRPALVCSRPRRQNYFPLLCAILHELRVLLLELRVLLLELRVLLLELRVLLLELRMLLLELRVLLLEQLVRLLVIEHLEHPLIQFIAQLCVFLRQLVHLLR